VLPVPARVSKQLTHRMIQYVDFSLDQQKQSIAAVDVGFLKLLSEPLYEELQQEIYEPHLRVHPFFQRLSMAHPASTRAVCRSAVATAFLAPRDVLFHPHQVAQRLYFVEGGHLRYVYKETEHVGAPEWFSEAVLWTQWLYLGHMQAVVPCVLVAVRAEQFMEVIKMHPEAFLIVRNYAKTYVEKLNDTCEWELTDLSRESRELNLRTSGRSSKAGEPRRGKMARWRQNTN